MPQKKSKANPSRVVCTAHSASLSASGIEARSRPGQPRCHCQKGSQCGRGSQQLEADVSDRGSELLSGATVSSRKAQAQSRCGSAAGELLAWRPDRVGHEARALMGVSRGVAPGLWQGSAACTYNENSNAILESTSRRIR